MDLRFLMPTMLLESPIYNRNQTSPPRFIILLRIIRKQPEPIGLVYCSVLLPKFQIQSSSRWLGCWPDRGFDTYSAKYRLCTDRKPWFPGMLTTLTSRYVCVKSANTSTPVYEHKGGTFVWFQLFLFVGVLKQTWCFFETKTKTTTTIIVDWSSKDLAICSLAYLKNARTNFVKYFVHVNCVRVLVPLWKIVCFRFLDDVSLQTRTMRMLKATTRRQHPQSWTKDSFLKSSTTQPNPRFLDPTQPPTNTDCQFSDPNPPNPTHGLTQTTSDSESEHTRAKSAVCIGRSGVTDSMVMIAILWA